MHHHPPECQHHRKEEEEEIVLFDDDDDKNDDFDQRDVLLKVVSRCYWCSPPFSVREYQKKRAQNTLDEREMCRLSLFVWKTPFLC